LARFTIQSVSKEQIFIKIFFVRPKTFCRRYDFKPVQALPVEAIADAEEGSWLTRI